MKNSHVQDRRGGGELFAPALALVGGLIGYVGSLEHHDSGRAGELHSSIGKCCTNSVGVILSGALWL